jgi:hypothetical protein
MEFKSRLTWPLAGHCTNTDYHYFLKLKEERRIDTENVMLGNDYESNLMKPTGFNWYEKYSDGLGFLEFTELDSRLLDTLGSSDTPSNWHNSLGLGNCGTLAESEDCLLRSP